MFLNITTSDIYSKTILAFRISKIKHKYLFNAVITIVGLLQVIIFFIWFWFLVFNATFNNISAISWRPVLVVEKAGVPGENHQPWASNW